MSGPSPAVVVIGAGPAGAGAALRLAQRGVSVWLIEKQRLPRGKVCGGCVHRRGVARLGRWGVRDAVLRAGQAERLRGARVTVGGKTLRWPRGHGWSVDRAAMDAALVTEAVAAGARVIEGVAAKVQADDDRPGFAVRLGEGEMLRPRWVLAADGLGGSALRELSGFAVTRSAGSHVGAGAAVDGAAIAENEALGAGEVRMFVGRGGYVGAVRGHGAGGAARIELAAALSPALVKQSGGAASAVGALLEDAGAGRAWIDAAQAGDWRLTPALTMHRRKVALASGDGGLMVIGDAAGYVEPFTGEGITWAWRAADDASALFASALSGAVSAQAAAARWSRRCAVQRMVGRRWCRATRWMLRRPGLVAGLADVAGWCGMGGDVTRRGSVGVGGALRSAAGASP